MWKTESFSGVYMQIQYGKKVQGPGILGERESGMERKMGLAITYLRGKSVIT